MNSINKDNVCIPSYDTGHNALFFITGAMGSVVMEAKGVAHFVSGDRGRVGRKVVSLIYNETARLFWN